MILNINYFGLVAEATQCTQEHLTLPTSCTVAELIQQLYQLYPALKDKSFKVAVNRVFVAEHQYLEVEDEIALLPPFAGG